MTDGVRRLNHEEAEMLISARMDEQLDRADSRALLVHLQTCESCRAFAVQSEVLGRELAALPVLPPSALVDRQIRETIGKGRSRWSLATLFPAGGGGGGLRVAAGALAMLTLVSVFLLIRMAGDQSGDMPTIQAPNGGVAQQIDRTSTSETALLGEAGGPTETPRVVVQKTPESGSTEVGASTEVAGGPTEEAGIPPEDTTAPEIEPTRTLDSSFVYTIDKTRTPATGTQVPTETAEPAATESSGDVAVAAVMVDEGTPADTGVPDTASADESPVATEPAATPTSDEIAEPTETPRAPAETPTMEATSTQEAPTEEPATEEPTSTPEAATSTPAEPTATETPVEISVDPTEVPAEPTAPPPGGESALQIEVEPADGSASPGAQEGATTGESSAPEPTQTPLPPTPTPSEPFAQPTIAPISGQTGGIQGTGESTGGTGADSPQIVPSGGEDGAGESGPAASSGAGVGAAGTEQQDDPDVGDNGGETGSSPQIVSTDATSVPEGVGGEDTQDAQGGDNQVPSEIPTVDDSVEPSGLDLSQTVTGLPAGTSSPEGRLEFSPGMNLYVVIAPDGQLAVADLEGELVVTLGNGDLPVWSGNALMFSTPGDSGTQVGIWNSDSGDLNIIPPSENEASDDVPVGGDGTSIYFLRSYPSSGILELRSATIDGSDNGVFWTSDSVRLGGVRPLYSESGIYLPTDSEWLFIDWDGNESSLGANPYGFVGAPVLSPGGGLMAYSAGDQVFVAWSTEPGAAVASAPYTQPGGYAFATSGEEVVVSDGSSLHVISYEDNDLGSLGGNQPIGAVYWISDTIYYVQIGEDAALKSTSLAALQSE